MTTQDQFVALAAELTRVGKMPKEIEYRDGYLIHVPKSLWGDITQAFGDLALSALLGVAAEALAENCLVIIRGEMWTRDGSHAAYVWEVWKFDHDGSDFELSYETHVEAVIAALKQIKVKK